LRHDCFAAWKRKAVRALHEFILWLREGGPDTKSIFEKKERTQSKQRSSKIRSAFFVLIAYSFLAALTEALFEFEHGFVNVAPAPAFTRFDGLHNRVACGMEMLCCVLSGRSIAATYVTAYKTHAQMHPTTTGL